MAGARYTPGAWFTNRAESHPAGRRVAGDRLWMRAIMTTGATMAKAAVFKGWHLKMSIYGKNDKRLIKKNLPIKQVGAKRTQNRAAGDGEGSAQIKMLQCEGSLNATRCRKDYFQLSTLYWISCWNRDHVLFPWKSWKAAWVLGSHHHPQSCPTPH